MWKIGIDEAGRGPLAGPVAVGVCAVPKAHEKKLRALFRGVKDSKQLTEKVREVFFARLEDAQATGLLSFAVGFSSANVIDRKGIVYAIQNAMKSALRSIHTKETSFSAGLLSSPQSGHGSQKTGPRRGFSRPLICPLGECIVLLDGSLKAPVEYVRQKTIIKGDEKEWVISLASIAAKVTRDRLMLRLARKYPRHGFEIHKGYGTALHRKNIEKYGFSDIHRRTFCKKYHTLD